MTQPLGQADTHELDQLRTDHRYYHTDLPPLLEASRRSLRTTDKEYAKAAEELENARHVHQEACKSVRRGAKDDKAGEVVNVEYLEYFAASCKRDLKAAKKKLDETSEGAKVAKLAAEGKAQRKELSQSIKAWEQRTGHTFSASRRAVDRRKQ
ncbi:hypothetical protein LTR66_002697 [Elasticomyces elasticus]|nr:hypothetical protein LTR66_002697 [Elasticomyces elasticus]KAK5009465.1 hypothetical protein LTR28_000928 [Elasticomyces elasticus]